MGKMGKRVDTTIGVGIKVTPQEYEYQVIQDGVVVASAWGQNRDRVLAEASHYAAQYAQDGPIELRIKPDHRKRRASARGREER